MSAPKEQEVVDFIPVAEQLGLRRIWIYLHDVGSFLKGAVAKPAHHVSAFSYFLIGKVTGEIRVPEGSHRFLNACLVQKEPPTVGDIRGNKPEMHLKWGPVDDESKMSSEDKEKRRLGHPSTIDFFKPTQRYPFQFLGRALLHDSHRAVAFRILFNEFFDGPSFVNFLEHLTYSIEPPEKKFFGGIKSQFPNLTQVGDKILCLEDAILFERPLTSSASSSSSLSSHSHSSLSGAQEAKWEPVDYSRIHLKELDLKDVRVVHLRVPLSYEKIKKNYPDVLQFFERIALLRVTFRHAGEDKSLFQWQISGKHKMLEVRFIKAGPHLLWAPPNALYPENISEAKPLYPLQPFSFDLEKEEDLAVHVDLAAKFCGITIELPQIDLLFSTLDHTLNISISHIDPTAATKAGLFLLGIGDLFEILQKTFALSLTLTPKEKDALGEVEGTPTQLVVNGSLEVPRSSVLKFMVGRKMASYTRRILGKFEMFSDILNALLLDMTLILAAREK